MEKIYDCIVIGGGVVGTAVLDRLALYGMSSLLLERDDDVASYASRANSGIVHSGYDCEPNTQKAQFNVRGNELMWRLVQELHIPNKQCGSIVVAPSIGYDGIKALYDKGKANGVEVEILNREQILKLEPNVAESIEYALYAPKAGIVSPYKLCIGLADRAVTNGAEILLEAEVTDIKKENGLFVVATSKGTFCSKIAINCAGPSGAHINDLVGAEHYETEFRRGEYFVLDNTEGKNINTVIFPLPTAAGKGILVAPTADGNVIYGPTSTPTIDGDNIVTADGLDEIRRNVPLTYNKPAFGKCIRVYSGVRTIIGHDFIVGKSKTVENFVMAIGICSPGLTSAPAIGEYIENIVTELLNPKKKVNYVTLMPKKKHLASLSDEELNALIKENSAWGKIVCRCEKVTEAEIVEAIHSPLLATTVDAVKRRVRAGIGRCQGGFCATRVMELLARELKTSLPEIRKGIGHSEIALFAVKEVPEK